MNGVTREESIAASRIGKSIASYARPVPICTLVLLAALASGCATASLPELVRSGRVDEAIRGLDSRPDLDERDDSGRTALMVGAELGHDALVAELIARGADPCLRDWSGGRGSYSFHRDEESGTITRTFSIAFGPDGVDGGFSRATSMEGALQTESNEADTTLTVDVPGLSPLDLAAANGHMDAFDTILPASCDPPSAGALVRAARRGDAAMVERLLGLGLSPDAATGMLVNLSSSGYESFTTRTTALAAAAQGGKTDVVRILLRSGADPDPRDCVVTYISDRQAFLHMLELVGVADQVPESPTDDAVPDEFRNATSSCRSLRESLEEAGDEAMLELISRGSAP